MKLLFENFRKFINEAENTLKTRLGRDPTPTEVEEYLQKERPN